MIRWLAVWLISAVAMVGPATAHPQKAAISQIYFNERSGQIEVAHRFTLHDAEAAAATDGRRPDLIGDADARDRFAVHAAGQFSLMDEDGSALPLTLLGSEIEGGHLWVYQETAAPDAINRLTIRNDVLRDQWPEQTNLVTIERGKVFRTLIFSDDTLTLTVSLAN